MAMEDGHLVLRELDSTPGAPATVDILFRTLASAHRNKAIGVVLSGMGSDGSAGLACIREHGGVTLVQLPADAEQAGMPQSAIDCGMADFVLTAAEIPLKLMELNGITQTIQDHARQEQAPAEAGIDMGPDPEQTLQDVLSLLHQRSGHNFRQYKRAMLLRRLERRMQVRGQADLPSYYALQRQDPGESRALFNDLLIGVTQFFRDREAFAALEHTILPQIFRDKGRGDSVRVWVAAGSTGEEAYSIAMLLADYAATMTDPPAIQVLASDIDAQSIGTARAGLYPASIADDVPAERLQRYFTLENGAYKVRKALRKKILFAEHNLLSDPAFSALDLVCCRNLLIYLNQEMHGKLLDTFHFMLRPEKYLMLGSAETIDDAPQLFTPVNAAMRLYQALPKVQAAREPSTVPVPRLARARPRDATEPVSGTRRARLYSFAEIHLHAAAQQAAPSILVNEKSEIVHIAERASRFLRHVSGEPTRDLVALVPPAWRLTLRTALFRAQKSGASVETGLVRYEQDGERRAVEITVLPFHDPHAEGLMMLVSLRDIDDVPPAMAPCAVRDQPLVEQLDDELRQTRHKLLETMDQAEQSGAALHTMVEELKTTVEELRSANTQLETALEKSGWANETLQAANADLTLRLDRLAKSHDDLNNLIASSDVATLFLDRTMRIQRYTPGVTDMFNVIPADIGRPLLHITSRLENVHLAEECVRVFETLQPMEQEVRSKDGRVYIVRAHPYRTGADHIDGAVVTFFDITSRRHAEKALRESEQRLTLAFAALPIGICTIDPGGNMVILNEVMRRFLPTGTIPSRDPARTARWRGWDAAGQQVQPNDFPGARALRGESVVPGIQMLYLDDDGKEIWTEVRSEPLRDIDGNITGALIVVIDVDRLKRGEEAAWQSEERSAFLLKLGDALRAEPDERSIGQRSAGMLAEYLGLDRCPIMPPDEKNSMASAGLGQLAPEIPAMADIFRLAQYAGITRQWTDGERMLLGEVAERTRAAIAHMRAERRAENILEHMGDAHSVLDRDYRIVSVNAAAERLLGRQRAELLGRSHWEAFPGSFDAPVGRTFRRVIEEGVEQHLTHHYVADGYDMHLEVDAYPTDEGGLAMFWRDVSKRVMADNTGQGCAPPG